MKYNKENYKLFITKNIGQRENSLVSINKIYTLYCSYYDIMPKDFSIKSFTPLFYKAYKEITGVTLEKIQKRLITGENAVTCIKDIFIIPFEQYTTNTQPTDKPLTINTQTFDNKNTYFIEGKSENSTTSLQYADVDITPFVELFEPGKEQDKFYTKNFIKIYNEFYKNTQKYLNLMLNDKDFKKQFRPVWDKLHPNSTLEEYKHKKKGRGYKYIKLKNPQMFEHILNT